MGGVCQPGTGVKCNDSNACTSDVCVPDEGCVYAPNQDACSDNDACTLEDKCQDGECIGTGAPDCEDNNLCTDDSCNPAIGCENLPNNLSCDDGDACTEDDYCAATVCLSGAQILCDDDNICTDDFCAADSGCIYEPNAELCEDGDECTKDDYCSLGECQSGETMDCDDDNQCTEDICNFDSCLHPFIQGECDDGEACTGDDVCNGGLCAGTLVANCGCYSLALNGTGYGLVDYAPALNLSGPFTIELWLKRDSNAVVAQYTALLSRWLWSGISEQSFRLGISAPDTLQFQVEGDQGGSGAALTGTLTNNNQWRHVAVVSDQVELALYIDGTVVSAVNFTASMAASTVPLTFGARYENSLGNMADHLSGWIDEIRISDAAIYSQAGFVPEPWLEVTDNTVGYWGANQGQFTSAFDTSGNALHAVLVDGVSWSTDSEATECVPKPNFPPSAPEVSIQPPNPTANDNLVCQVDVVSVDGESDPIQYEFAWYKNGVLQEAHTTETVPASATSDCPPWQCDSCEKWTCKVIPTDGKPGMPGTASTEIGALGCQTCDGQVHGNNCYLYNSWATTWGNGASSCTSWGGHLVTIMSGGENDFVNSICPGNCWIGLSDSAKEGTFVWVTGDALGYNQWSSGEPNDWLWAEDCAHMKGNGKWNDDECDSNFAFICEKEP